MGLGVTDSFYLLACAMIIAPLRTQEMKERENLRLSLHFTMRPFLRLSLKKQKDSLLREGTPFKGSETNDSLARI